MNYCIYLRKSLDSTVEQQESSILLVQLRKIFKAWMKCIKSKRKTTVKAIGCHSKNGY